MFDLVGRELHSGSMLLGAAAVGSPDVAELLMLDADGVLWLVSTGTRRQLVRWCLDSRVRYFPSVGYLVEALQADQVIGLVPSLAPFVAVLWTGPVEGLGLVDEGLELA